MKYLLGLLLIVLVAWYWRTTRAAKHLARKPSQPQSSVMAVCKHCGVHVPAPEAIAGARGPYCSEAHRQLAES